MWRASERFRLGSILGFLGLFTSVLSVAQIIPIRPLIVNQPQSATVEEGERVTFRVQAESFLEVRFQWNREGKPIEGATEPELQIENVRLNDVGAYSVMVENNVGSSRSEIAALRLSGEPVLVRQPESVSQSLGPQLRLSVFSSGTPPFEYQWMRNGEMIEGEIGDTLTANVALSVGGDLTLGFLGGSEISVSSADNANVAVGEFVVMVKNALGEKLSDSASVEIDLSFTKILDSPVVEHIGGGAWGDFDNDGRLDFFGPRLEGGNNDLVRNTVGGFELLEDHPIAVDGGDSSNGVWGDINNDGLLDLFVVNREEDNFLYLGQGDSRFTRVLEGALVTDQFFDSDPSTWADFDGDGLVDIFLANGGGNNVSADNVLYRNLGNAQFEAIQTGDIVQDGSPSESAAWSDFDLDGDVDVLILNSQFSGDGFDNVLYENRGDGTFVALLEENAFSGGNSEAGAWADYDDDGRIDLFVSNSQNNFLYRNDPENGFIRVEDESNPITSGIRFSRGAAWGDYDNDGDLDLFVANLGDRNRLYRNEGSGRFLELQSGSLVNDIGGSVSCNWVDYDNDGYLDLFVGNETDRSFLYRNNGNGNRSIKLRFSGKRSNRLGIGVKARVLAKVFGEERWQLRELIPNDGNFSSPPSELLIGIGDASLVDRLIIEWPSGIHEERREIAVPQNLLLVIEEPDYSVSASTETVAVGGSTRLEVSGGEADSEAYQWFFNGEIIDGAIQSSYEIVDFQAELEGAYSVEIRTPVNPGTVSITVVIDLGESPSIDVQPMATTVSTTGTAQFEIQASGNPDPDFQWYFGDLAVPGATSSTLVLEDVSAAQLGDYSVVVGNLFGSVTSAAVALKGQLIQDQISASQSLSLGAALNLGVQVSGLPPVTFRWFHDGQEIEGETGAELSIAGVGPALAGNYHVTIENPFGMIESDPIPVFVDETFIFKSEFPILQNGGEGTENADGSSWVDFNNDGFLDLFRVQKVFPFDEANNALFENLGGEGFVKITDSPVYSDGGNSGASAWADFDNNGFDDLFVANTSGESFLYRNLGEGEFVRVSSPDFAAIDAITTTGSWVDYDNDGWVDLLVGTFANGAPNYLLRNEGNGPLVSKSSSEVGDIVAQPSESDWGVFWGAAWADYDRDGWMDVYIINAPLSGAGQENYLYRNREGVFERVEVPDLTGTARETTTATWGDYNNDGWIDLFVGGPIGAPNRLYRNREGVLELVPDAAMTTAGELFTGGASWGDYDNDGDLDLFLDNGFFLEAPNALYRNDGDGQFTRLTEGTFINDSRIGYHVSWADYNNDGFLDLWLTNDGKTQLFFENNGPGIGNKRNWLRIVPDGNPSNRSAIGAKITIQTTIDGGTKTQFREIFGGVGWSNAQPLEAHFGLGAAEIVDVLRIQWPSGNETTLTDVAVDQILYIRETGMRPSLSIRRTASGEIALDVSGDPGAKLVIETSVDLKDWERFQDVTLEGDGSGMITETLAGIENEPFRFLRVRSDE